MTRTVDRASGNLKGLATEMDSTEEGTESKNIFVGDECRVI